MKEPHIHIPLFLSTVCLLFFLTTFPQTHSQQYGSKFWDCSTPYISSSSGLNLSYPFWGDYSRHGDSNRPRYCGGMNEFKLFYSDNDQGSYGPFIKIESEDFLVLDITTAAYTMTIVRPRFHADDDVDCYPPLINNTLSLSSSPLFQYTQNVYNITVFYYCPDDVMFGNNFTCSNYGNGKLYAFYVQDTQLHQFQGLLKCKHRIQLQAVVPLKPGVGIAPLRDAVGSGFEVKYDIGQECKRCMDSDGVCGRIETDEYQFSCHCQDGSAASPQCKKNNTKRNVILGATVAAIVGLFICMAILYFSCKSSTWQEEFWLTTKTNHHIEAFLKSHGDLTLKRYKFSDVKKMTNSFKVKLGQGGFGSVYKGELPNNNGSCSSSVAVKLLNDPKGNDEDFINEVASISRTSHVNVVTLLGFCLQGNKRALIYEFMPNGSLDKFIYQKGFETSATPSLSFDNLYEIALGIARGLEYLHRGCNTRILHFDIKPHNILLDDNLCPKISDFGLAKLCPRKESIISMSNARGTIGYLAPEMWNRHFGGISHKSDVYSYGMVLLEMVGEKKNISNNVEGSHSSEIYFPDYIYKRLDGMSSDSYVNDGVVAIGENEIAKKMTLVGLWCIQTIPNDRPTISKVIEMLEGNMNSLEVPPKPVLSSPPR